MGDIIKIPGIIVKDAILFPGMTVNFTLAQNKAVVACEEAMRTGQLIFVASERDNQNDISIESFYEVGIIAHTKQINKLPNHSTQLVLESIGRGYIKAIENAGCLYIETEKIEEDESEISRIEKEAMLRTIRGLFFDYLSYNPKIGRMLSKELAERTNLSAVLDSIAGNIPLPYQTRLTILQSVNVTLRFEKLVHILNDEIEVLKVQSEISKKVKDKVESNQKQYYLREQMAVIKKELGDDVQSEEQEFLNKLETLEASEEVKNKIKKEISRFASLNGAGSEASVERIYIETLLDMPWDKASKDNLDIKEARKILEEDHYGLEKIKERILEFLAVKALNSKGSGQIICLVGPPGTGKTSIAKSVARALNKKYVRVCLGGVRDEAEIRGHRRTYVGALPGSIVAGIREAKVKNPLMLLDEIDKVGSDHRGDTASALLEVLDSEQNEHFMDHYLSIPIDLSEVFFIATANSLSEVPKPLLDRMEIIEVGSYTAIEKFHICKDYLIPKELEKNGLNKKLLSINDAAIEKIIDAYTREAGVRSLERKIGEISRKAAKEILESDVKKVSVNTKNLKDYLGKEKYRRELKNKKNEVGIVRGLAYTVVGGDTLSIEVNVLPGKGELRLTGQMGDVMKESAMIGLSYVRSVAASYKVKNDFFNKHDIHIHIPEGAVPKDGPSAGVTMATAMLSAIAIIPVSCDIAMTGEVTLRGRVLAVGGLKEKTLAAKMAGITKIIVPKDNERDIEDIPKEITDGLDFVYVSSMKEVLKEALIVK